VTIIERIRSATANNTRGRAEETLARVLPGALGQQLSGAISQGIRSGPRAAIQALRDVRRAGPDLLLGQVFGGTDGPLENLRANADRLRAQLAGEPAQRVQTRQATPKPPAPTVYPIDWSPAPVFGELGSMDAVREAFQRSAMIEKSWKNLYHVAITEYRKSQEAPGGAGGFNDYVFDVSFAPVTMPGEQVQLGSANLDSLPSTERVELRMTVFDDIRGSVARWFIAKCDQAAPQDGTFGLPVEYLVTVDLTHMATRGPEPPSKRLRHKFVMRPTNIEIELSRRESGLQELQLSFVQWDTFFPVPA
jgi:hypothetical protein